MSISDRAVRRRRPRVAVGWVVGVLGVAATLVSIGPSVVDGALVQDWSNSLTVFFVVMMLLVAAVEMAVPVLIGLAVADARGRWLLWLVLALAAVAVVWVLAPSFGTLGVFWGPR